MVRSEHGPLADDGAASMNLFGFDRSVLDLFGDEWARWIVGPLDDTDDECRLPEVLNDLVARGVVDVDVIPTAAAWMGITYSSDLEPARAALVHRFA